MKVCWERKKEKNGRKKESGATLCHVKGGLMHL